MQHLYAVLFCLHVDSLVLQEIRNKRRMFLQALTAIWILGRWILFPNESCPSNLQMDRSWPSDRVKHCQHVFLHSRCLHMFPWHAGPKQGGLQPSLIAAVAAAGAGSYHWEGRATAYWKKIYWLQGGFILLTILLNGNILWKAQTVFKILDHSPKTWTFF